MKGQKMDAVEKRIIDAVEARRDDLVEFFRELVREKSFTRQERGVAEALVAGLRARGFDDVEIVGESPDHPNVLAYLRGIEDGPTFTFNGHMDLIAPQEESQWVHKPFSADMEDGKIFGRGTVDMKSGTFSSFFAGLVLNALKLPLRGKVMFTGVCDEEICGKYGMLWLLEHGYIKKEREDDFGLNCEPTDLDEINMATKGVFRVIITVIGRGAFGARPYLGISAIEKAAKLVLAITSLNEKLRADPTLKHDLLEPPSVLATLIDGGEATNLVPDRCRVTVTRRMVPCETKEKVLAEFQDIFDALHAADPDFKAELREWDNWRPPVELPRDAQVVSAVREAQRLVRGTELRITGSEGGTDASHVVAKTGIVMPVYGPGDYRLLGTINEYVTADDFIDAIKIYALVIWYTMGVR